jgi:hypothetical protein
MLLFRIAQELGKSVEEVANFSATEIRGWSAFLTIQYEESKKQANKKH